MTNCVSRDHTKQSKAQLHLQLGSSHLAQGNYPAALAELLTAEKLDPDNAVIQNNLGLAYFVRNHFTEAELHFRRALDLKKEFTEARNNLGRVLIEQNRYKDAIKELKTAERDLTYQFPEKTLSNLGMAYFLTQDFKRAEESLRRSLEIRRKSCVTLSFYGRSLLELKEFARAAETLDQAVETCRGAKFEDPLYFCAMSYYSLGQHEQARARIEELLSEFPQGKYADKAKGIQELLR